MYDPMVAKLIVWDVDREKATRRMLRALDEYEVGGLTTLIPFHKAILATEQWAKGETCRDLMEDTRLAEVDRSGRRRSRPAEAEDGAEIVSRDYKVEVSGKLFDVKVIGEAVAGVAPLRPRAASKPPKRERKAGGGGGASSESLPSPLQGTVFKVAVEKGAEVAEGDLICVIEAMKMENEIVAHRAGKVEELNDRRGRLGLQRRRPRRDQVARRSAAFLAALRCCCSFSAVFLRAVPPFSGGSPAGVRLRVSGISAASSRQVAADAVLEPFEQFVVEEVADREVVGDADDVVELVGVLFEVVELLLAVRPGDVLVGAEADSLVVLGRRQERGAGFAACGGRAALAAGWLCCAWSCSGRPVRRSRRLLRRRRFRRRTRRGRAAGCAVRGLAGTAPSSARRCSCRLRRRPVRGRRRDVDVADDLAGFGAGFDVRPADQEGQVGGGLVGEELAADQPVLAEEEAVVGGEDDVGVAQPVQRAQRVDDQFDPVVDRAQRLERLVVVDAVGVDVAEREVRRFADEARLVADVALVEAFASGCGAAARP